MKIKYYIGIGAFIMFCVISAVVMYEIKTGVNLGDVVFRQSPWGGNMLQHNGETLLEAKSITLWGKYPYLIGDFGKHSLLAREIRGLIASGALSDDPAALEKVARVLVAVSRDDAARLRAENAALKTRIAELEAENAKLREAVPGASSADVAEAMKRKFGVT